METTLNQELANGYVDRGRLAHHESKRAPAA